MTNKNEQRKVPELRFPEFRGEWERKLWGDLGEYKKSYSYSRAYEEEGIFRHIHYGDIHTKLGPNINNLDELNSINVNDIHELVQYGDLIIADASEDYKDLGKVTRLNINDSNIISGLHTHLFRVNNNIDSRFLLYYSKTSKYQKLIRRYGTGVSVLGLSKVNLNKFDINLPSFEEQQKIGEFFSKLDRQIELEEKKLALLEEQKKGYMQKIFSQELRFKDENGEEYPEWEYIVLKNYIRSISIKNNQIPSSEILNFGKYEVVDQSNKNIAGYTNEEEKVLKNKDKFIIFGDHTTTIKYRKNPFVVGGDGVKVIEADLNIEFLYALLKSNPITQEGYKRHYSILKEKKYSIVNNDNIQEKIGKFYLVLEKKIDLIKNRIDVLIDRKNDLLKRMLF